MKKSKIQESIQNKVFQEVYRQLGEDINDGKLENITQVYGYVSKTQLATDLKFNSAGFLRLKAINPSVWRVEDIMRLAKLTGAKGEKIYALLTNPVKG